jgi:hypothetical protein
LRTGRCQAGRDRCRGRSGRAFSTGCPDCQRHEFALSGYRIYEIAESQTLPLNQLPTLEATNSWMHGLLAEG